MEKKEAALISQIKSAAEKSSLDSLFNLISTEKGENLLVISFAACYKAVKQALNITPFDEQLSAGIGLIANNIVQMSTGEGKTVAAVFAAYFQHLLGKKLHILTFNDYLAKRDYNWMKPVYDILGVNVAYIQEKTPANERKSAYSADVLYISAKECCFDFLRDFVAQKAEDVVGTTLDCAIVDEADSILIDEARIPLVVAGNVAVTPDTDMPEISTFTGTLPESAYEISEENESVYLTDKGARLVEKHYQLENLYDDENCDLLMKVNNCLKAWFLLKEDTDYIVKNGSIQLIDKFTGRVAGNRHYPGSLQGAVELKHGVSVTSRGTIMGTIPLQFFARNYEHLSGMTGTAESAEDEFYELYDLSLKIVPPHVPSKRVDHDLQVYFDEHSKWLAIADAIIAAHAKNQPILIGTRDITESDMLKAMLEEKGVTNVSVLNAKNDEMEAEIIKNAGALGNVTVSTNMAGRGVDIKLGGADEKTRDEVIAAGGLLVISTFMAESSRINKQLLGRCGRQGDIGESRRFVSLDEPLMTKYKLVTLVPPRHYPEKTENEIDDKVLLREIERIQRISEGDTLDERKRLLKFTMIGEKHRDTIFNTRKRFLMGETPKMWQESAPDLYEQAVSKWGQERVDELERRTAIAKINDFWCEYLEYTENLREGIHLSAIAGKNPAEEYNISAEAYYQGMEEALVDSMTERLEKLLIDGADKYEIPVPSEIWTYLLEGSGDELNKKPFLNIMMSDEADEAEYQSILAAAEDDFDEDVEENADDVDEPAPQEEKPEKSDKKGFFGRLFKK